VLGASGLQEAAGGALGARVEEGEVVGVAGHLAGVVFPGDGAWVGEGGQVEEEVGEEDGDGSRCFGEGGELGPGVGQVEVLASGEESEEEDLGWGLVGVMVVGGR
jgi:hypothetical protein